MKPILIVVHQATSTPGLVGEVLQHKGYELDIRCPAEGDELPPTMDGHLAAIVFGGPMSANDSETLPFIRQELHWIPLALESEKPFFGICLGAQLLAKVLGAKVSPHPEGIAEIGYFPITPTEAIAPQFPFPQYVYHWHREGFELPAGAQLLATGKTFPNQAFRYGKNAYAVQFHPEITRNMVKKWTRFAADMLTLPGAQSRDRHLHHNRLYAKESEIWLREFLENWLVPTHPNLFGK